MTMCAAGVGGLLAPAPHPSLPAALAKTVPKSEKLFSASSAMLSAAAQQQKLKARVPRALLSPTNRRLDIPKRKVVAYPLDSARKGCGWSFSWQQFVPRLGLAGCPRPPGWHRGPARGCRNGLAVLSPEGTGLAVSAAGPPIDPSGVRPRAGPGGLPPTSDHSVRHRPFLEEKEVSTCRPSLLRPQGPCLLPVPAPNAADLDVPVSDFPTRAATRPRRYKHGKNPIQGLSPRPFPWVTIAPRKEFQMARGNPRPTQGGTREAGTAVVSRTLSPPSISAPTTAGSWWRGLDGGSAGSLCGGADEPPVVLR